ncbi:glycosyltransferase family 2 protein [Candidatus Daviesbacteria bacterium]|nr:glycosyltransferase family 2 protein [Candidatus Daviesbacteria bacterium]
MFKKLKVVAILPAYQAEKTLLPFFKTLPKGVFDEVILVDDCSSDKTYEIAKKHRGIKAYQNPKNLGYGGNVKQCLKTALKHGADVMIEIHPDGEYGADGIIPALLEIKQGAKFVLGNRFAKNPVSSGMFLWKYVFIRVLNLIHNLILRTNIPDLHQGFRVYTRQQLSKVNFKKMSDGYIFSFEIIVETIFKKMHISSVPVSTKYQGAKRGAYFKNSLVYGLQTLAICLK